MPIKPKTLDETPEREYKFPLVVADWDTVLFRSAKQVQQDYILAEHKPSGVKKEFPNATAFYGHWKKKEGGWLRETNDQRLADGKSPFAVDDFTIHECSRLNPEISDHLKEAEKLFDFAVGNLKKAYLAPEYKLVIGGKDNFRYKIAKQLPYKGARKDKPILFSELREFILGKYRNRIIVVEGREADDYMSEVGYNNYLNYLKTRKWDVCLAFIDKDISMVPSPCFNYDKPENGVTYITSKMAARNYCIQLLIGDKGTDNIPGLPCIPEGVREKYGMPKTRGLGKATAEKFLPDGGDIKDLFQRVVDCYKEFYGVKKKPFVTWEGETVKWDWKDYLRDTSCLLWMYRDDTLKYDIFEDTLKRLGVVWK